MKKYISVVSVLFFCFMGIGQTQNYWLKIADFTGLKRERAVAFTIDGKGYVGTGVGANDSVKNDFWEFDPVVKTWTQMADLNGVERRNAIAFSINKKGYVGTGMNHSEAILGTPLADFMEFDPVNNSWNSKTNFPGANGDGVYFATGFSTDSKGYICGGKKGPNNYSEELWEYAPLTDSWLQLQNFPGGVRYQLSSFVIDNLAYVGLGIDQDVYRRDFWQFSPATNNWISISDFMGGERGAASTFTLGQRGFVSAGADGGFKNDLWEYNSFDDSWSVRADFGGSPRKNAVAFSINGKAYMGTGKGNSGKKKSFYEYIPYDVLAIDGDNLNFDVSIDVFPNPIQDFLLIEVANLTNFTASIYSLSGELVLKQKTGEGKLKINCSFIKSGIYVLSVSERNSSFRYSQQIIIK